MGRTAEVICDGTDKRSYTVVEVELAGPVDLTMLAQGGCLVRID